MDTHWKCIWASTGNLYGHPLDIAIRGGHLFKKILKGNYGGGGIQTTEWAQRASNFCKQVTPPTQDRL